MSHTYSEVFVNTAYPAVKAFEANSYYQQKNPNFTDSTIFLCSDNCAAQITCANYKVDFNDPKNKDKNKPYFVNRKKMQHSPNCNYWAKVATKRIGTKSQTKFYTQSGNDFIIEFIPREGLVPQINTPQAAVPSSKSGGTSTRKSSGKRNLVSQKNTPHRGELGHIVDLFEEFQAGNTYINIFDKNRNPISFSDLFEEIPRGKVTQLSNLPKIYYGQAFAEYLKSTDDSVNIDAIKIIFSGKASLPNSDPTNISFIVYRSSCTKAKKKLWFENMEKLIRKRKTDVRDPLGYFTFYFEGIFELDKPFLHKTSGKEITRIKPVFQKFKDILPHITNTPN